MTEHSSKTTRRNFLGGAAAFAAVLAAHRIFFAEGAASLAGTKQKKGQSDRPNDEPRILALELLCGVPLERMKNFYHDSLGLRVLEERRDRLTIAAGQTRLTFVRAARESDRPFYHFAFNIPENKIRSARDWQRERSPLLPIPARFRDGGYPDDVIDYRHWNAHSVFFFDPAGNVVEHIARHDLANSSRGAFSSADILYASEIAFVVDDVPAAATRIREFAGLEQYRGGDNQFRAIGDERGLLLVMRRGRVISFDSPERKAVDVFRTSTRVRGARRAKLTVPDFPYSIALET